MYTFRKTWRHAMHDEWNRAVDETAEELLSAAGITGPPVDAFAVAAALQLDVVFDRSQPTRGRHKRLGGRPTVFLRPDERPERNQWALAHEIGEAVAWRVAERIGDMETLPDGAREDIANRLASRILLPSSWFFADAAVLDDDLFELKQSYSTASHALIALRLLDRELPGLVTLVDNGRTTCRKSNTGGPPPLLPEEREAANEAHHTGRVTERAGDAFRIRAWPVHEPGWKREILWTVFAEEFALHRAD
jgi:IrrE N-terminal-like domain